MTTGMTEMVVKGHSAFVADFMRTAILLGALFCTLAVARNIAAVYGPASWRPQVHCGAPVIDLGSMKSEGNVGYAFDLVNAGGKPLTIRRVVPECGCTTLQKRLAGKRIGPGEHQQISGRLAVEGLSGAFRKSIVVETNDPRRPILRLELLGTIDE